MSESADSTGYFQSRLHRRARPGMFAIVLSIAIHAGAVGAAAYARSGSDSEFDDLKTYRVKIYSPPPQVEGPPQPPPATPTPPITQPDPKPKAVEEPKPQPKAPEKPKHKPEAPKPAARPATTPSTEKPKTEPNKQPDKPVTGQNAKPDSPGGENIDVDIAGAEFPFPEYLQNVILQMSRYFRWTGACNLSARVGFYIREDGSVMSPRVLQSSKDREFDRAILRALDMINKAKAFGPLPDEFTLDRLAVAYTFDPPCGR